MSSQEYDAFIEQHLGQIEYLIERIRKQRVVSYTEQVVHDEDRVAAAQALSAAAEALSAFVKAHYPNA